MNVIFHNWLRIILLSLFILPQLSFSNAHIHPFYVGVVEVAHNKSAATLELSCKLFAEDVETALEQYYKTTIDINDAQQTKKIDALMADYVPKHLTLQTDKKKQTLHYIGFEREAESVYIYFEVKGIPLVTTIGLTNSLLYDFTDKQINIIHVMVAGVRKSYKLDYPKTDVEFSF